MTDSQVHVVLLLDPLRHQLALLHAELLLVTHHLTLLVLVHGHAVQRVHDAVPTQHLAWTGEQRTATPLTLGVRVLGRLDGQQQRAFETGCLVIKQNIRVLHRVILLCPTPPSMQSYGAR